MKHKYQKRQFGNMADVEYFVGKGFPQSLAEALSARGITQQNYLTYFGNVECFHDPFEMANMREAVETIQYLMESGGSVLIYGDYDADGISASSLLSLFFSDNGIDNDVIIPLRSEGYGLHAENVFKAFDKKFYDLVITVDCGISNAEEICKIVNHLGVEIIVTDHHELPKVLPDCICVNPKLGYPFAGLSGSGVAWKLVEALAGRQIAEKYSDLAMIGTIADIMPMQDENRSIVKLGLSNWKHKSLCAIAELSHCGNPPTVGDISMKIGPRINSAGRVLSPMIALAPLLQRDKVDTALIEELLQLNDQRKQMTDDIIADADTLCDSELFRKQNMVFLYSNYWHSGVLGIVASRYKEKYNLPCLVMTASGENYVGSARSAGQIDLFDAFSQVSDYLVKFGGHKASVGFTVAKDKLDDFRLAISKVFCSYGQIGEEKTILYDVELSAECKDVDVFNVSEKLQPLLPQDKFLCRVNGVVVSANTFGKDGAHLSLILTNGLEVKGFGKGRYAQYIRNGANVDLICSLEYDSYAKKICGMLEDIVLCNSVCFDDFYKYNLLNNFEPKSVNSVTDEQVANLLQSDSCLAVFDDYETYLQCQQKFDLDDYFVDIFFDNSYSKHTVVISPLQDYNFANYANVVVFCKDGFVRNISNAQYCVIAPANNSLYDVPLDRNVCTAVYSGLKRKSSFDSISGTYDKYLAGKVSYSQYIVALRVFQELQLIQIEDKYSVTFCPSQKTELTNSQIFNCFAK